MKSLLMTDEFNRVENLFSSLETDLGIMESLEKLMLQEDLNKKQALKKREAVVKQVHYRKSA